MRSSCALTADAVCQPSSAKSSIAGCSTSWSSVYALAVTSEYRSSAERTETADYRFDSRSASQPLHASAIYRGTGRLPEP